MVKSNFQWWIVPSAPDSKGNCHSMFSINQHGIFSNIRENTKVLYSISLTTIDRYIQYFPVIIWFCCTLHCCVSSISLVDSCDLVFGAALLAIGQWYNFHCSEVIMSMMASQITTLPIVYSSVYSGADQRKHQSSVSLVFVRGIHRWPVNSLHRGLVTWKNVSIWWCHHVPNASKAILRNRDKNSAIIQIQ